MFTMHGLEVASVNIGDLSRAKTQGRISFWIIAQSFFCEPWAFFRKMLGLISLSQIGDRWGLAPFTLFARRIFTAVYSTAKFLGLVPRRLGGQNFRELPICEATLAAVDADNL